MNVNGSKFKLMLSEADWGKCLVGDPQIELHRWNEFNQSSPPAADDPPPPFAFDATRGQIALGALPVLLPPTSGEARLTPDARRAAGADRNGNIYAISADRSALTVAYAGASASPFWPHPLNAINTPGDDFAPEETPDDAALLFEALAVTEDHYLVSAFRQGGSGGLMVFDLAAGGGPAIHPWPAGVSIAAFAMVTRAGGGAWILDRMNRRLWELDRHLNLIGLPAAPANDPDDFDPFQSDDGALPLRPKQLPPQGIDLTSLLARPMDPVAIQCWSDALFILDCANPAGASRVLMLSCDAGVWTLRDKLTFATVIHDIIVAGVHQAEPTAGDMLLAAPAISNQLQAFAIEGSAADDLVLRPLPILLPCRLFGGRALVSVRGIAHYDTGLDAPRWIPVVQQPRATYPASGTLVTPVFDSSEHGCVWDRIVFDGSVPPGTRVLIEAVAADDRAAIDDGPAWIVQPQPYRRAIGSELPWHGTVSTRTGACRDSWELLLQGISGRYCRLRLTFTSEGMFTPRIGALRIWHPRFSYAEKFLPAVYREDPVSGDFVERLLANFEGVNTTLEGRIANAQTLFDPRTAPPEALEWLASWFDVALDPAWDNARRRMFIRHAMAFFRWRGTMHGLQMALNLAFDPCFDERAFDGPWAKTRQTQSVRIVEAFLTRRLGALLAGDPSAPGGPIVPVPVQGLWSPAEGNSGLCARFADAFGAEPPVDDLMQGLTLAPPTGREDEWQRFALANLGFVPAAGAAQSARWRHYQLMQDVEQPAQLPDDWPLPEAERSLWRSFCETDRAIPDVASWRSFLLRRYRTIAKLNAAYATEWPSFDVVALPWRLPQTASAQADWLAYERRVLPMKGSAHRFSVLLAMSDAETDQSEAERRLGLARSIVELEKPAHTVFDVRYFWALNRIGEARLGIDTLLGQGSRAPELIPPAVVGRAYIGASFVSGRTHGAPRVELAC